MCTPTQGVWQRRRLCVCPVSLFVSVCVARACRHHLSRVHPYRAGVQSEPDCSSPSYHTYIIRRSACTCHMYVQPRLAFIRFSRPVLTIYLFSRILSVFLSQQGLYSRIEEYSSKSGLYPQIFFIFPRKIAENRFENEGALKKEYRIGRITYKGQNLRTQPPPSLSPFFSQEAQST